MTNAIAEPGETGGRMLLRRLGLGHREGRSALESRPVLAEARSSFAAFPGPASRRPLALPLRPLIAEYTATFGSTWRPLTRIKHAADFARFIAWLETNELPLTTASLDFGTLLGYVTDLRARPRISGVWRGAPDALAQSRRLHPGATLSLNSINAYMRPLRSLAIWLVDEELLAGNPFRRSRRRAALNPLLPAEETPTKSATLDDLQALERGCIGAAPLDLRDRAIVSLLKTTAARNSSVRLLAIGDIDFDRSVIRFRRAKGGKTLDVALQPETRAAITAYLAGGRPALVRERAAHDPAEALFLARVGIGEPDYLSRNAISLMLTRRYHAGGGQLRSFGSHRIRHGTATMLVNNGMGLDEVSRYLGHSSTEPTRRYAVQTPAALGRRAAEALARAGLV
jgi:integrase